MVGQAIPPEEPGSRPIESRGRGRPHSSLLLSGATATSPWKFFPPTDQAGASSGVLNPPGIKSAEAAYQDYLARLHGQTFVSEQGGTWGRSQAMLADLGKIFPFVRISMGVGR